jgi:hypothetical protein
VPGFGGLIFALQCAALEARGRPPGWRGAVSSRAGAGHAGPPITPVTPVMCACIGCEMQHSFLRNLLHVRKRRLLRCIENTGTRREAGTRRAGGTRRARVAPW